MRGTLTLCLMMRIKQRELAADRSHLEQNKSSIILGKILLKHLKKLPYVCCELLLLSNFQKCP